MVVSRKSSPSGRSREVGEGGRGAPDRSQVTEADCGEVDLQEREAGDPEATKRSFGPSAKREKAVGRRLDKRRRWSSAIFGKPSVRATILTKLTTLLCSNCPN